METKEYRPKWKASAPKDRILFFTDGDGIIHIIDYIGESIVNAIEECCLESEVLDELERQKICGIWIWEGGVYQIESEYDSDPDIEIDGTFRALTEKERQLMICQDDVWDKSLWIE